MSLPELFIVCGIALYSLLCTCFILGLCKVAQDADKRISNTDLLISA